jgi:hypothetical protein
LAFFSARVASARRQTCRAACWTAIALATLGGELRAEGPVTSGASQPSAGGAPYGSAVNLRQDALRNMPLSKLTPQGRNLAQGIINDTTVFRRLPTQQFECDAELYTFMLDYPDLVINMWEVMGVTKVRLTRIGPNAFNLDDGAGTTGKIYVLYRSPSQHVVYAEGNYVGSMVPRAIRGRCVVTIRHGQGRSNDGRTVMQCRLDSFVQLDNFGVELLAKAFHTALGNIADHNLKEICGFVSSVHQAAETAPENLERITNRCGRIPEQTRNDFLVIADRIYEQAMGRAALEPVPQAGTPTTVLRPTVEAAPR